jgi:hypothetical protein
MAGDDGESTGKNGRHDVKRLITQRETSKQRPPDSQSTKSL